MINNKPIKIQQTYLTLPKVFYQVVETSKLKNINNVVENSQLLADIPVSSSDLAKIISGEESYLPPTFAQAYAAHQFGHFTILGDGRAHVLGSVSHSNENLVLQYKGSGRTKYSRRGDGRATLSQMLREYVISEYLNKVNIPTTRSVCVFSGSTPVYREESHTEAVLVRAAKSFIRVGTFQYAKYMNDIHVKELVDYIVNEIYSEYRGDIHGFITEVIKRQAELIAKWQSIGFVHGVMNTDNMLISGETIDYGPCAFMEEYNPDIVYSSIDRNGRYAFKNQPNIAKWNLARFVETLLTELSENQDEAIEVATDLLNQFDEFYHLKFYELMFKKIGVLKYRQKDYKIINKLLDFLRKNSLDYTNFFYNFTNDDMKMDDEWLTAYNELINSQEYDLNRTKLIKMANNPVYIPRNEILDEVLKAADKGDLKPFNKLLKVLDSPFNYDNVDKSYQTPKISSIPHVTYCGT